MIDEIRAWNVAKTQAEVQDAALQALTGQEPGLVGYWNFDNPSGLDSSNGKFYTELDSTAEQKAIWLQNREKAYFGSRLHFMRCYYDSTLAENGFVLEEI